MTQEELQEQEQALTRALSTWAAMSIGVGGYALRVGGRRGQPDLAAFGRQTSAWGVVDAVIAAAGTVSRARRGTLDADAVTVEVDRLRRLLLINAAADVAYIVGGLAIAARGRAGRTTLRMRRGDGLAIVLQGTFLLVLDTTFARRLSAAGRSGS